MKTYNVQLEDTVLVIEAAGCGISHGVLIFKAPDDTIMRLFNQNEWKEVWVVSE